MEEVPLGVVILRSTVPAASNGAIAVIDVSELMVKELAAMVPNLTALVPVKLLPVITTWFPAVVGPELSATETMEGAEADVYVN
jgi:hypothetical protein